MDHFNKSSYNAPSIGCVTTVMKIMYYEDHIKMAERRTCLSVLLFLLHPLVIKAKFGANKHSDTVGRKSRYQADVLCSITRHDASDWNGFCWCYERDKGWRRHIGFGAGRAFRIKDEGKISISFALAMLLCCYVVVVIFVQILDLVTSDTPAEYVRKQSKVTKKESVVTFVRYGFIQKARV